MNRRQISGFVRAVLGSLTWRKILTAWLLGFALLLLRQAQNGAHAPTNFILSALVITNFGAVFVLLAALTADEAIRRGARPWLMFMLSLAVAAALTTFSQWYVRKWLHLYTVANQPGVPMPMQRAMMIFVAGDVIIFGGFAMLAFLNRRSAQRMMEGLRGAELRRVQIERQLTESRLATTRAHIDPGALFEALGEIKNLYASAAPRAELRMDALIQQLQATVTKSATAPDSRSAPR